MKRITLCLAFCLFASLAQADEPPASAAPPSVAEGEHGEVKKAKPEKPKPDSAISTVLQLPVVRHWGEWMAGKKDGSTLVAWGEALKAAGSEPCWGVAVGENRKDGLRLWRRFCVQKFGIEVWVESVPDKDTDEITYTPYEDWIRKCGPTPDSAGNC